MIVTLTYSVELDDEDVEKIKKNLNRKPSLTPYVSIKDYLKDRLHGTVILELQDDHEENLGIKCHERYFQINTY